MKFIPKNNVYEWYIAWELTTGTIFEMPLSQAKTFTKFKISSKTLPVGSNATITVYKNWVSDCIWTITTAQALVNGLYTTSQTTFTSWVYSENDRLTISVTAPWSTTPITNLTWQLI